MAEWTALGQVPGSTHRFVVIDSERDLGFTIEGTFQVKIPKGGGQAGASFPVEFVAEHIYPLDPTWDGQGEPPAAIRARADRELREKLEEDAEVKREALEKGKPIPAGQES